MGTLTNDPNPKGTEWYNRKIYGKNDTIFPEEDYQVAAMPRTLMHRELGVRLRVVDKEDMIWKGKKVDFSAVSDKQLLHHISLKLGA